LTESLQFAAELAGRTVGVSVTRAMGYPSPDVFDLDSARRLLQKKLFGILRAREGLVTGAGAEAESTVGLAAAGVSVSEEEEREWVGRGEQEGAATMAAADVRGPESAAEASSSSASAPAAPPPLSLEKTLLHVWCQDKRHARLLRKICPQVRENILARATVYAFAAQAQRDNGCTHFPISLFTSPLDPHTYC
jgi:hypothetical protein